MMEHKAFLFNFESFDRELRVVLEDALISGDCTGLISFIEGDLANLKDPYEGEPLIEDWENLIETQDPHQYGDFAMTKYYDPKADLGLGASWDEVQQVVAGDSTITESPILGITIGPPDDPFDPGKMGAYLQSRQQVQRNYSYLTGLGGTQPPTALCRAIQLLKEAVDEERGLYVTF